MIILPVSSRFAIRFLIATAAALSLLIVCTPCRQCSTAADAVAPIDWTIAHQNQLLGKCMNLGNALEAPTEGAWGVTLKKSYFVHVKQLGFNSVRIPVRWSAHVDTAAPYTIDETFFNRVLWAVDEALANDLRVIINVHHFEALMADPERNAPIFLSIWQQVANRCAAYGPELYFELCNEPNGALTAAMWNDLAAKALAAIRRDNPERSIIIGPVQWNSAEAFADLTLPADSFLIATFHCYEPAPFTHQGASWVAGSDFWKGTRWRASRTDTALINSLFDRADRWAAQKKVPLFLGEFGALDTADTVSRTLYTAFIAKQAQKRNWSYAYWKYNNNFGIFDDETNTTRDFLLSALLKPDSTFTAWQQIAASDTLATPPPGSDHYLLLDDFDDSLPRQSSLVLCPSLFTDAAIPAPQASCYWNCWYKSGCMMKSGRNEPVAVGNAGLTSLVGPWGVSGNGLHVKAYLKGDDYPTLTINTSLPGRPSSGNWNMDGYDFSSVTAISFQAKGYGAWTLDIITDTIANHYPPSENWGNFTCAFEPTAEWKQIVIPVGKFKPRPWSKPQQEMLQWKDGMRKVIALSFSNSQNYGKAADDSLELYLDDIRLYGLSCTDLHRTE